MFDYQEGFLHLLFCNETDEFYLDALLKFDLHRYLFYQLEKEEYKGVFFIQCRQNRGMIYTENHRSEKCVANFYGTKKSSSFFSQRKPEYRMTEYNGRQTGAFDFGAISDRENEIARFIIKLLREDANRYAVVLPLKTFTFLYQNERRLAELISACERDRDRSIMLVYCPMDAAECAQEIMNEKSVFHSALCPGVRKLIDRKGGFVIFDELEKELGGCYHILDPLRKTQIRKMIEYGVLFRDWRIQYEEIKTLSDFIYLWYHSAQFMRKYPDVLPENEWRDLSKLRKWLSNSRNISELKRIAELEAEERRAQGASLKGAKPYRIDEALCAPIYRKAHSYAKLSQIDVEALAAGAENAGQMLEQYYEVVSLLRKMWSDGRENDTEVEYCAEQLESAVDDRNYGGLPSEKIIALLHYSVSSNERKYNPDIFQKKIGYYKQVVELSFSIADTKKKIGEMDKKIRRMEERKTQLIREIQASSGGEELLQDTVVNPKKREVVSLEKSRKNISNIRRALDLQVNQYEAEMERLELVIIGAGEDERINYDALAEAQKTFESNILSIERSLKKFDKLESEMEASQDLLGETVTDDAEVMAEEELDDLIRQLT